MKSRPVSVNVTANGLAANQAQQTANQAQASAIKYKTAWEEANAENLAALSTAQSEFKSNLAWVKSQIHEGKHQNDSAVASLQSDMESSWDSMSTVEQSLYNSASTATSEVDSHLESLRAQNSQSLADLHNTANSLHAAATSLHADANAMRSSLTAATSELGKDITTTRNSLDGVRNSLRTASSELGDNLAGARNSLAAVDSSLRTATSEVGNNLNSVKNSLAAVDADLRNGIKQANNDLSAAKTSLTATGNSLANRAGSLATATSELQRQTGQLSGSLSTADSMIMFNSNAIAEVKRTAGEISTTVSNIRVGGRNLLTNTRTLSDVWNGTTETVDGFTVAKATNTRTDGGTYDIIAWNGLTNIKSNTDYVLTFYAKASKTTGIYSYLYNIGPGDRYMDGSTRNALTTDYQRYTVHFHTATMPAGRTVNCLPVRLIEGGVTAWVYGVQLEEGNIATQWQPNPADTDQAISKVSQTADAIRADLTNTKGDVASVKATASSLQTQITDNKNNISTVKQTADSLTSTVGQMPAKWQQAINDKANAQVLTSGVDMNNLTTAGTYLVTDLAAKNTPIGAYFMAVVESTADKSRILQRVKKDDSSVAYERSNYNSGWTAWERAATGTDITQVKQTIDGITTRVSNTEGNVSGLQQTAKSIQTSVSDNAKNISNVQQTATALQSDLSNAKGDISSLQQTASGLTSRVGNAEGSISQLQQTANGLTSTVSAATHNNDSLVKTTTFMNGLGEWSGYNAQDTIYVIDVKDVPNNLYTKALHSSARDTLATKQFIPVTPGDKYNVEIYFNSHGFSCGFGVHTTTHLYSWVRLVSIASTETGWVRKKATWTVPNDVSQAMAWVQLDYDSSNTLPANRPNVWIAYASFTKIDSVLDASISQIQQTADRIQSQVNDNKGNISSVTQTANAVKTDLANTKGDVSSLRQTAKQLTSDMADAKGNISRLQQTATGLQSTVQSQSGKISQLQQDADGLKLTATGGGNLLNNTSDTLQKFSGKSWSYYPSSSDEPVAKHQVDGKTVTLSAWIENPSKEAWVQMYTDKGKFQGNRIPAGGKGWSQVTYTMPSGFSGWNIVVGCGDGSGEITLSYSSLQLELGPNRTAWSQSTADIAQLKVTAGKIQTQVNDNKGNISSVTQTANAVKADLANTKGDVSSLRQTANGLQSTVADQSGKISQLQQDADGLSATVGGAAIDIIPNLDKEFVMGYGIANTTWQDNNSYIKLPTTKKNREVLPQTAGFAMYIPWQAGKTYMQSIIFETDATIDDSVQPQWTWFTKDHAVQNATLAKLGDNTYRLIGSYTPTQAKANSGNLRVFDIWNFADFVDVTTGTYLKFRNPRIWCPDDNSLAQLKLTADGLTSKVADTQGNVSKLQLTASSLQTQITNNKNDVASVKVKADGIRTDLTNAKNDIASVKSKADSLTSSMTNANNQISTLQQRADSLTSTLGNGGVNLLNGTSDAEITNTYPTSGYTDKVSYVMSVPANRTDYVLSFDAKATVAGDKINCYMYSPNQVTKAVSNQNVTNTKADGTMSFTLTTNWVRYWVHYTITPTDQKPTIIVGRTVHGSGSGTVSFKCVQLECGDNATPWQPSNGDISSLQQTASQLTSDMKDAKGNISSLQQTAGGLTSDVRDAKGNISSLQQKATELDAQIKAVDGRATTIKATADGISARVSKIEGNQTVGSLLKLTGTETGLGSYVNGKLIAGINTNTNGNVTIDGKQIHLTHYTQIDDGCINASKITVHNSVGNDNGEAKDQYLAAAWGQLNSTIGKTTDNGKTSLWGSINQTAEKFSSYYTRADVDNKLSQQSSLISQTANNITALVNDAKNFTTFTVSSTNKWDFNNTKSAYGNWFLNGDTSSNYVYNGPSYTWGQKLAPCMYVTSRGPKDGSRFVVTVWKDNDPTQYQRVWNGSWSDWVMLPNSQNLISAINLSPDSVKISGKNIELNGNTKVTGRLDLMQDSARSVSQSTNYHNNWVWNNAHIYFDNYLQLLGENCNVHYTNTNTTLNGGKTFYSITTLTPGYLKFTTYNHKVNDTDENFDGQITRSYLDSGRLETPEVYTDKFVITGHHIRVRDNQFLMLTNKKGTNFDNNGSVGFQVWGGIVLGQNTIGAPSNELYFQRGNIDAILGQSYSDAPKLTLHAQKVVSQEANSVSSRLSVKTSITKVTYDRALMAVQNTDMYDYRYIADNSGQHYVSGIIDDVHDKPEYNMDPMLINQERTARIDANLLGYHHVVLLEILKRLDKLEAK